MSNMESLPQLDASVESGQQRHLKLVELGGSVAVASQHEVTPEGPITIDEANARGFHYFSAQSGDAQIAFGD